jgi:hypothetical protein
MSTLLNDKVSMGTVYIAGNALLASRAIRSGFQNVVLAESYVFGSGNSCQKVVFIGEEAPFVQYDSVASVGDEYHQHIYTGTALTDVIKYLRTGAGWVRQTRQDRLRNIQTFGSTDTRIDSITAADTNGQSLLTWVATGTAVDFRSLKVGDKVYINESNFNAANRGTFLVTSVAEKVLGIYNPAAVAETNKVTANALITALNTGEAGDDILVVNNAAATTLALVTAVGCEGKRLTVKNVGAGVCSIDANGTQTIDGLLVLALPSMATVVIVSDGANWRIESLLESAKGVTALAGDAHATPTAAQLRLGIFTMIPDQARNFTLPTPALTYAVAPSGAIGTCMEFTIVNNAAGASAITVVAGTGWTNGGLATHLVVSQNVAATFMIRFTSSTAAVIYRK